MERISMVLAYRRAYEAQSLFEHINKGVKFSEPILYSLSKKDYMLPITRKEGKLVQLALEMNEYSSALYLIDINQSFASDEMIEESLSKSLEAFNSDIEEVDENNIVKKERQLIKVKNLEALTKLKELYPSRVRA